MKEIRKSPLLALFLSMLISIFPLTVYAEEETDEKSLLSFSNFESESFQGWAAFGNKSVISITDSVSHDGKQCIKSDSRTASWSGPALNISNLVVSGTEISFQAYVRSTSDNPVNIMMSVKSIDTKGTENYSNIDSAVTGDEWVFLEGSYTIPENMVELMIYFQTEDCLNSFYIDDIKVFGDSRETVSTDNNNNNDGYEFDFENNLENWLPRGDISVLTTKDFSYSGDYSLYISGRKDFWSAPMVHLNKIKPGVSYNYSAYVMYNGAEYEQNHVFSLKLQYHLNGAEIYSDINSKTLHKGIWSKLEGDFIVPKDAEDIVLYIQTADVIDGEPDINDLMSFYVDNIVIFDSTTINRQRLINSIIAFILCLIGAGLICFVIYLIIKKSRNTKKVLLSASMDAMTKTFNRNTYEERIKFLESSPEKCAKLYITVCDVNFLKYINDNYGHEAGDKAIIRCAEVLLKTIGKKGKVYRTGGDEFMCITKSDLTNDIKTEFSIEAAHYKGYPFSVAVGTAHYDKTIDFDIPDVKVILTRSDKEMYKHKQEIKKFTKEFAQDMK